MSPAARVGQWSGSGGAVTFSMSVFLLLLFIVKCYFSAERIDLS